MTSTGKGIAFAVLAVTIFAAQDGLSKHLASNYPPALVVMLRYWAFAAFAIALAARGPGGIAATARSKRPILQIMRGVLLAGQIVLAITAFAKVGLAATHAIFATGPLAVAALSMPVLGERVGWRRWTAIGVGLSGVLLILRPGGALFEPASLFAVSGALGLALYAVLTRLASRTDSSQTSFFYTGVAGAVAISLIGPFHWTTLAPSDWIWMGLLCLTGVSGHYCLIRAYEHLDAVAVQPFSYLQLVMVSAIGVSVFGERVDFPTVAGAAIIVAAGLFTIWRESIGARRKARVDTGADADDMV